MAWVPIITTNLPPHLASFKGLVEAQGGAVAAGDRPGGGAVFTIRLRLANLHWGLFSTQSSVRSAKGCRNGQCRL